MGVPQPDYGARHVAALVLMVEPGRWPRIDPGLVATALGLTRAESQVAVWLAEGKRVRDMATATGLTEGAIYWHLKPQVVKTRRWRVIEIVRGAPSHAAFSVMADRYALFEQVVRPRWRIPFEPLVVSWLATDSLGGRAAVAESGD